MARSFLSRSSLVAETEQDQSRKSQAAMPTVTKINRIEAAADRFRG